MTSRRHPLVPRTLLEWVTDAAAIGAILAFAVFLLATFGGLS